MRKVTLALVPLLLATAGSAAAEECVGLEKIQSSKPEVDKALSSLKDGKTAVDCASLMTVLNKLFNGQQAGGRKLEAIKPLDRAEAQANLDQALQNEEVRAQLDKLQQEITDENARILYEAAVLDAEGFYPARELRIAQLRDKLRD